VILPSLNGYNIDFEQCYVTPTKVITTNMAKANTVTLKITQTARIAECMKYIRLHFPNAKGLCAVTKNKLRIIFAAPIAQLFPYIDLAEQIASKLPKDTFAALKYDEPMGRLRKTANAFLRLQGITPAAAHQAKRVDQNRPSNPRSDHNGTERVLLASSIGMFLADEVIQAACREYDLQIVSRREFTFIVRASPSVVNRMKVDRNFTVRVGDRQTPLCYCPWPEDGEHEPPDPPQGPQTA
jgi:hypothetical protein